MNDETTKQIREKIEDLIKLFENLKLYTTEIDHKSEVLISQERELRHFEKSLNYQKDKLQKDQDEVEAGNKYIEVENKRLYVMKRSLEEDRKLLKDIEFAERAYIAKKEDALKEEKKLDEKIKQFSNLETKAKEYEAKQLLIDKEKAIDAERKRLLDIRENRIKVIEHRLQIDQSE